ncbi:MAG: DUF2817 domain-containing protein [Bradymonadales bacterium]|nr:MAG: DUF2817 domain-containing protein [Bradymonadales bacterium]
MTQDDSLDESTSTFYLEPGRLPELERLEALIERLPKGTRTERLQTLTHKGKSFPIHSICFGSPDPSQPTLALVGGVHGLERIGSQTIIAYLESLVARLEWDEDLQRSFETHRLVCLPILNPVGMMLGRRSNGRGVDLMRNAPVEVEGRAPFLVGGQRISPWLPWFRGKKGDGLETESQVLVDFIQRELFSSSYSIALDVHSGFGMRDRLWYPYAKTKRDFPGIRQIRKLKSLLKRSYPNHVYLIEAQHKQYLASGDLWDYLLDLHPDTHAGRPRFLPLTLEMGSWLWVKKNPLQILSHRIGSFHPIKSHRQKRTFRRHIYLFEFLMKASKFSKNWIS